MEQIREPRNKHTHIWSIDSQQRCQDNSVGTRVSSFQQMMQEQLNICKGKKRNLNSYLISYTKINLKWSIYLNLKVKTIQFLEENIGVNLCELGTGKDFLDKTHKA